MDKGGCHVAPILCDLLKTTVPRSHDLIALMPWTIWAVNCLFRLELAHSLGHSHMLRQPPWACSIVDYKIG